MAQLLKDVRRTPLLSRQDEQALAERVQQYGDERAFDTLVRANLRFVVKVAHGYRGYGLPLVDLVQEGALGLTVAVRKFEPARGFRLISYAVWWVRAFIQNYVMHAHSMVKLGTTQAQRRLFFKLRSAREQIERLHAHSPLGGRQMAEEIGRILRVRAEEVESMQVRMGGPDASIDAPVAPGRDDARIDTLAVNDDGGPESCVGEAEQRQVVRQKVRAAMHKLNVKEQYIVAHRLLCDEPLTLQAVGDYFSISRERARQIESVVMRKMRHALREFAGVFGGALSAA